MKKIRIGVICPSEIAFRRFMPAIIKSEQFDYVGIAVANYEEWFGNSKGDETVLKSEQDKAENFKNIYGGKIFTSYKSLLTSDEIDAVYIPLPPALHFKWAKIALENGKHVMLEKPFTTSLSDTIKLLEIAENKSLAVHENYMFAFHTQLDFIKQQIADKTIGEIRLIRIDFGFPFRGANDFRYNKALGGGALLDCGGYTIKLASMFLGDSAEITSSQLNSKDGFDVDIYGSASLTNKDGLTAQLSFGMDNSYRCSLDVWGSTGSIYTNRVLTAPDGFEPVVTVRTSDGEKNITLPADDTFKKSIERFAECVADKIVRKKNYFLIETQAKLCEKFERI